MSGAAPIPSGLRLRYASVKQTRIGSTVAQTGHTVLPKFRLVVAVMALLALTALGISLFSAPRNNSVFAVGLRSAQGSPVERALPEPPDWKQFVALAALRRSQELDRLLDLPVSPALDAVEADAASLADLAAPAPPDAPLDFDTTGAIDQPPPDEAPVVLSLPELPDIPDVASSFQQALARDALEANDTIRADREHARVAAAPAAEAATGDAAPSVILPSRVRLPPVRPPRVVARKKPRVARAPAARRPAAAKPAPAGLFGPPAR